MTQLLRHTPSAKRNFPLTSSLVRLPSDSEVVEPSIRSGIDMASQLFVAQVKSAKSFSELRKLFAEEDQAELKFAADPKDWNHVLTAVKSCGYEDNEFPYFLQQVQKIGSDIFLQWSEHNLNCRSRVQFTILLSVLKDLGILDQPPVSEPRGVPSPVCGDKRSSSPNAREVRLRAAPGLCIDSEMMNDATHSLADRMRADASRDQGDPSLSSLRATEKKYVSQPTWATLGHKIAENSESEVKPSSLPMKVTLRMEPVVNEEMSAQEDTSLRRCSLI